MKTNRIKKTYYEEHAEKYSDLIEEINKKYGDNTDISFDSHKAHSEDDDLWNRIGKKLVENNANYGKVLACGDQNNISEAISQIVSSMFMSYGVKKSGKMIYHMEENLLCMLSEMRVLTNFKGLVFPHNSFFIDFPSGIISTTDHSGFTDRRQTVIGAFVSNGICTCCNEKKLRITLVSRLGDKKEKSIAFFTSRIDLKDYKSESGLISSLCKHNDIPGIEQEIDLLKIVINSITYIISKNADLEMVPKDITKKIDNPKKKKRNNVCRLAYTIVGKNISGLRRGGFDTDGMTPKWKLNRKIVVSGHSKRQHYGPGNSLVKIISLLPYEKGPKDTPLESRDYLVK